MKIFFDTEFIEDGKTIDLLSIGAIREDGAVFYAESEEADHAKACEWVRANVLPHLLGGVARHSRKAIADTFRVFCGPRPEFWAYYSDYDWVALCQLYGRMVDLPDSWPMFCRDVKQLCVDRGNPTLPPREGSEHHALQDARWAREAWEFLSARPEALRITRYNHEDVGSYGDSYYVMTESKDGEYVKFADVEALCKQRPNTPCKLCGVNEGEKCRLADSVDKPHPSCPVKHCEKCGLLCPRTCAHSLCPQIETIPSPLAQKQEKP